MFSIAILMYNFGIFSLPVPLSPDIKTEISVGDTCEAY